MNVCNVAGIAELIRVIVESDVSSCFKGETGMTSTDDNDGTEDENAGGLSVNDSWRYNDGSVKVDVN